MTINYLCDTEGFLAFPESSELFYSNFEKDMLLPIASLKYKDDVVVIAAPIEPDEGLIGEGSENYYNETCRENWISYTLVDEKLKLDCDSGFFRKGTTRYLSQTWYSEVTAYYNIAKDFYRENGFLQYKLSEGCEPNIDHRQPLFNAGGIARKLSNWHSFLDVRNKTYYNPIYKMEEVIILDKDDGEYDYLGHFDSYFYMHPQSCSIHVFYHTIKKQVLLTFEYS